MRLDAYPFVCLRPRALPHGTARLAERFSAACPLERLREQLAGTCPDYYRKSAGVPVCGAHFPDLHKLNSREAFLSNADGFHAAG